jgi:molybdate transport system ATP-binding protein
MLRVAVQKRRGSFELDARFEMPTPGVVALFGRSGCGKSTLVEIIAGLLEADSGLVQLDDEVLLDTRRRLDVPPERRRIGYVFQDARLFPHLNVESNLRYAQKRAVGASFVSFESTIDLLGLAPLLARRTHQLSGGERQRVAIARALLTQPRMLLLDEPLASLDAAKSAELLPYLESLRDRLAIPMVYVSHDFEEVLRLATHIVLIERGLVVAQGGIGEMNLRQELRAIIGADAVGAIVDGQVLGIDAAGLTRVRVGFGELRLRAPGAAIGATLRIQILARDVIVASQAPQNLSVRNVLEATVGAVTDDDDEADLISLDIGATPILARITKAATRELSLRPGMPAWALIKAVSLRGRSFTSPAFPDA